MGTTSFAGNADFCTYRVHLVLPSDRHSWVLTSLAFTSYSKSKQLRRGSPATCTVSSVEDVVRDPFHEVPRRNRGFVGRADILAQIEMEIAENKSSDECRPVALFGLGGMGKTQLMLEYCYSHRKEYRYIFWLGVDGKTALEDSFRRLAQNLGLDVATSNEDDPEKIIKQVLIWLERRTGWLILLDNADKDIFRYIPRVGGDVILTTRDDISTKAAVIPVDKMRHDDALLLLLGSKDIPHENSPEWENARFACARKIVVELDYMPLAVDLARAYVRRTRTSLKEYLTMLNKERDILFAYRDDSSEQYNHTMATVWQLSFQRVRQQDPVAAQILEACAFLHPDAIPAIFFENQSSILSSPGQGVDEHSKRVVRAAIAVLIEFSFLKPTRTECEDDDGDPSKDTLAIHRLVQMVRI